MFARQVFPWSTVFAFAIALEVCPSVINGQVQGEILPRGMSITPLAPAWISPRIANIC
jgi:hypothetical protein